MADKRIDELEEATSITGTDLFVLEQANTAKKLTGQTMTNFLLALANGHGGISTIAKTSSTGTNPVVDTYTITFADNTTTTFQVTNGVKGDQGPRGYTGNPGADITITSTSVQYQEWTSGTSYPTGTWLDNPPSIAQGNFLWTRTIVNYSDGGQTVAYSVARNGVDGNGAVSTVCGVNPDGSGNVALTASDVGALPSSYQAPVTSVNNKTGTVVLDNDDVNAERFLKVTAIPTAEGWYRAASFEASNDAQNGVWGFIFDITITRAFGYASNDVHSIRLLGAYNNIQFVNEVSKSNVLGITAIRYTTSSTKAYIDIYCGANGTGDAVTVDIVPHTNPAFIKLVKAESLQSVVAAPSGETITASYNFHWDISSTTIDISSSVTLNGFTELQKKATLHDGVVDIFIETNFTSYQANYEYTIGAVAAAYAPKSNVFFTAQLTDANFNPRGLALFTIYTNGNMTVRINNTDGNYPILHANYSIF